MNDTPRTNQILNEAPLRLCGESAREAFEMMYRHAQELEREANKVEPASSADLLDAIADLLECFGKMEGTWYDRHWSRFGITDEMGSIMEKAWSEKYQSPNTEKNKQ
jgi:hypothetical protein